MALNDGRIPPKLSRRTCSPRYELQPWRGKSAGVAKRPRERSPARNPFRRLHIFSSRSVDGEQAAYIVVMRDPVRRIAEQYIEWGNQVSPFPPQPAPPPAPPHPGRLDFSGGGFTGRTKRQAPFNAHHFYKRQSSLSTAARFVEWLRTQPDNLMVRARLHHCWDEIVVVPAGALRALRKRLYSVGH
jgi:hypothetical protein